MNVGIGNEAAQFQSQSGIYNLFNLMYMPLISMYTFVQYSMLRQDVNLLVTPPPRPPPLPHMGAAAL